MVGVRERRRRLHGYDPQGTLSLFHTGKPITIVGLDLYAQDVNKHPAAADKDAATSDLAAQGQFTFTAGPDAPEPTQVLTRAAGAQVFLIVSYSLW